MQAGDIECNLCLECSRVTVVVRDGKKCTLPLINSILWIQNHELESPLKPTFIVSIKVGGLVLASLKFINALSIESWVSRSFLTLLLLTRTALAIAARTLPT